jgi:hypothetical protein
MHCSNTECQKRDEELKLLKQKEEERKKEDEERKKIEEERARQEMEVIRKLNETLAESARQTEKDAEFSNALARLAKR